MKKILTLGLLAFVGTLALAACNEKGDAQKVGEKLDNTYQDAKAEVTKALDEGPAEKAGKKLDAATEKK